MRYGATHIQPGRRPRRVGDLSRLVPGADHAA